MKWLAIPELSRDSAIPAEEYVPEWIGGNNFYYRFEYAGRQHDCQAAFAYDTEEEANAKLESLSKERAALRSRREDMRNRAATRRQRHSHRWEIISHEERRCLICGTVRFMMDE